MITCRQIQNPGEFILAFGWNGLGIALHENIALIQITDITGVAGLSFLLVMVNIIIVITLKRLKTEIGRHKLRPPNSRSPC